MPFFLEARGNSPPKLNEKETAIVTHTLFVKWNMAPSRIPSAKTIRLISLKTRIGFERLKATASAKKLFRQKGHVLDPLCRFPHAPDSLNQNISVQTGQLPDLEKEMILPFVTWQWTSWLSPAMSTPCNWQ